MTEVVGNWLEKTGPIITSMPDISLKHYAARVEIPLETLRKYVCTDVGKRRVLGNSSGKKQLLNNNVQGFSVDMMRARDRGNDAMTKTQAMDMIQDLAPNLKRTQIRRAFDRNVRPANKHVLTGLVKAQATTVKRSAITVPQQFRWHTAVDRAFDFLREKNSGLTIDGKTFGEVAPHFILGGDETSLQASNGDVTIIGDKLKKKHEVSPSQPTPSTPPRPTPCHHLDLIPPLPNPTDHDCWLAPQYHALPIRLCSWHGWANCLPPCRQEQKGCLH